MASKRVCELLMFCLNLCSPTRCMSRELRLLSWGSLNVSLGMEIMSWRSLPTMMELSLVPVVPSMLHTLSLLGLCIDFCCC